MLIRWLRHVNTHWKVSSRFKQFTSPSVHVQFWNSSRPGTHHTQDSLSPVLMDNEPQCHSTSSSNSPHEDMPSQVFGCSYPECDYKNLWKKNVRRHEKSHDPTKQWNIGCQICLTNLRSLFSFFDHMSNRHANQLLCPWCLLQCGDLPEIKAHVLAHSETQPASIDPSNRTNGFFHSVKAQTRVYCSTCFKSFSQKSSLCRHNRMNHYHLNSFTNYTQKQAVCNSGQESFKGPEFPNPLVAEETFIPEGETQSEGAAELLMEKVNIEGETFYSCTICGHKTKRRDNLKTHFLVHTDHRPFGCPIQGCNYRAKSIHNLKAHSKNVHYTNNLPAQEYSKTSNGHLGWGMDSVNETQDTVSRNEVSFGFACMLCDFIGDSELAAMEHAQQHKTLYC